MPGTSEHPSGHAGASRPILRAGSSRKAWTLLLVCIAVALGADLLSKSLAFRAVAGAPVHVDRQQVLEQIRADPSRLQSLIPDHPARVVVPRVLQFQLVLNSGAVFGAGQGQRWFFVVFTGAALCFALFMFARWTGPDERLSHLAIGAIIAGGIGNLYDRLRFACVRDFIHPLPDVKLPFGLRWPTTGDPHVWPYVSNVADALLIVGIGVLLIQLWRKDRHERAHARR